MPRRDHVRSVTQDLDRQGAEVRAARAGVDGTRAAHQLVTRQSRHGPLPKRFVPVFDARGTFRRAAAARRSSRRSASGSAPRLAESVARAGKQRDAPQPASRAAAVAPASGDSGARTWLLIVARLAPVALLETAVPLPVRAGVCQLPG